MTQIMSPLRVVGQCYWLPTTHWLPVARCPESFGDKKWAEVIGHEITWGTGSSPARLELDTGQARGRSWVACTGCSTSSNGRPQTDRL